jgi:hypothetical protein
MTTLCTLGPFMTLILTLTAKGKIADSSINPSRAGVAKSPLFARLVIETRSERPIGNGDPTCRACRIGRSPVSRVSLSGAYR